MNGYSEAYECDECPEIYSLPAAAEKCCRTGDYATVFQCDTCKKVHAIPTFAAKCCPPEKEIGTAIPKALRAHDIVSTSRPIRRRTPDPNCDACGIITRNNLGRVVSCRCMK